MINSILILGRMSKKEKFWQYVNEVRTIIHRHNLQNDEKNNDLPATLRDMKKDTNYSLRAEAKVNESS